MRLAKQLNSAGRASEARELYLKVIDNFPESEEACEAKKALLSQAHEYERQGMVHTALDVYQKLL